MRNRVLPFVITLAVLLAVAVGSAEARPRPAGRSHQSNFEANKTFGLGIMLGAPTGLTGKYFVGPSTAIDFGIGGIAGYRHRDGLHLHADFLWHPLSLVSAEAFELPLYVGVGGRFFSFDYNDNDRDYDNVNALGVRLPVGIAFDFNEVPLDVFFELALVFDFISDDYYDDNFDVSINGAIGIRYWFN